MTGDASVEASPVDGLATELSPITTVLPTLEPTTSSPTTTTTTAPPSTATPTAGPTTEPLLSTTNVSEGELLDPSETRAVESELEDAIDDGTNLTGTSDGTLSTEEIAAVLRNLRVPDLDDVGENLTDGISPVETTSTPAGTEIPTDLTTDSSRTTTTIAGAAEAADEAATEPAATPGPSEGTSGPARSRGPLAPEDAAPIVAVGVGTIALTGLTRQAGFSMLYSGSDLPAARSAVRSALGNSVDRLWRVGSAFRYSRHDDSDPLEHDVRAAVHEAVEDQPGLHLSALSERVEVPLSTVRHHVRVLERERLLAGVKLRGKRRLFPAGSDGRRLVAALADGPTAAVLDALVRHEPASVSTLARELDRDASTISHHLSRLAEDGLVERERDGRQVLTRLSPEVRTALVEGGSTAQQPVAGRAD